MNEARWDVFFRLGMEAYQNGDYGQACEAFGGALDEVRQLDPPDLRLASTLNNLACALSQSGQVAPAIALQEEALGVTRQLVGDDHELVQAGLVALASDYVKLQRYGEAEALLLSALARGQQGPARKRAWDHLSQLHLAQDRLPEAARALTQLATELEQEPQELARVMHMLTHVYDALGDVEQADASRQSTLELIESLWGSANLAYAEVVASLAESVSAQQRFLKAAPLYARAWESFRQCVPEDDPRASGCLLGQLIALRDGGDLEGALELTQRVVPGWTSPTLRRRWLNECALVHILSGHYEQALPLLRQALDISDELTMPARISIQFNLASALFGAGRVEEARPMLENLEGLAEEHLGPDHALRQRIALQLQELLRSQADPGRS